MVLLLFCVPSRKAIFVWFPTNGVQLCASNYDYLMLQNRTIFCRQAQGSYRVWKLENLEIWVNIFQWLKSQEKWSFCGKVRGKWRKQSRKVPGGGGKEKDKQTKSTAKNQFIVSCTERLVERNAKINWEDRDKSSIQKLTYQWNGLENT